MNKSFLNSNRIKTSQDASWLTVPIQMKDYKEIPYLMTLNGLWVVCFQFPISKWLTHKSIGKSMLYGAILFGIGLLAIGWLPKWFHVIDANDLVILSSLLIAYTVYTVGK